VLKHVSAVTRAEKMIVGHGLKLSGDFWRFCPVINCREPKPIVAPYFFRQFLPKERVMQRVFLKPCEFFPGRPGRPQGPRFLVGPNLWSTVVLFVLLLLPSCKLPKEKIESRRDPNPDAVETTTTTLPTLPADLTVSCQWLEGFRRDSDTEALVWLGCDLKDSTGEELSFALNSVIVEAAGEGGDAEGLRQGIVGEPLQPDFNFLLPLPASNLLPWTTTELSLVGPGNILYKVVELDLSAAKAQLSGPGEIAHEFAASPIRVSTDATVSITHAGGAVAKVTAVSSSHAGFALKGGEWPGTGGTCATEIRADCGIVVTYAPTALSEQSGALTVTYETGLGAAELSLVMTGSGELSATGAVGQMSVIGGLANRGGSPSASTLSGVSGVFHDGSRLIVADTTNHRVLIYPPDATTGTSATIVLGQDSMTAVTANRGAAVAANTLSSPRAVYSDGTRLFVADAGNHRVLIWNTIPTTNGADADLVLGQANMTSSSSNRGAGVPDGGTLSGPRGLARSGTRLFVADTDNHRILIWDTLPTADGQNANLAVGQADLISGSPNRGGSTSAQTLSSPTGLWITGTTLLAADRSNHRVLIWDTLPTANGQAADQVLGQDDLNGGSQNAGESAPKAWTFNQPLSVWSDGTRVVVGDSLNYRILFWNEFPQINGESADMVFGQPDFVTNVLTSTLPTTVYTPSGLAFAAGSLWIADSSRHRVLVLPLP
jgi:hypothetical protein